MAPLVLGSIRPRVERRPLPGAPREPTGEPEVKLSALPPDEYPLSMF